MKHIYIIILLCLGWNAAISQTVSVADAMTKARALRGISGAKGPNGSYTSTVSLAYTSQEENNPLYYVFNYKEGGFAIIGGDERAREILAYCDKGTFDIDRIPADMRWWLNQYSQQINAAITCGCEATSTATAQTNRQDVDVMLQTTWNQSPYYNSALPTTFSNCPVGCVATAMAQVMKYYDYPAKGKYYYYYKQSDDTLKANFSKTTYDWENMPTALNSTSTQAEIDAVSTLMYQAGVSVHMEYAPGGSGADFCAIARALRKYFAYDSGIEDIERPAFGDNAWESRIYNEIAAKRPVIYGGQDVGGQDGHCFVLDGYRASDNTYHVNWGWGGYCDGYFAITGTTALHGGSYYFVNWQEALLGVQKPVAGSEPTNAFFVTGGYSFSPDVAEDGKSMTIICDMKQLTNYGYEYSDCEVGLLLVNKKTQESYAVGADSIQLPKKDFKTDGYNGFDTYSISCDFQDIPAGTYSVQPACKLSGLNQWHSMGELDDATLTVVSNSEEEDRKCDANGDGEVTIDDVTYIINHILKKKKQEN